MYRRHGKECERGRPEDTRTSEFDETRRGGKKCDCLIHVSGTLGGEFRRVQTGKANWDEAKAVVAEWQAAQSWDGQPKVVQNPPPPTTSAPEQQTIARAIEAFTFDFEEYAAPRIIEGIGFNGYEVRPKIW